MSGVEELDLEALSIATFAGSASPAVRGIGASGGVAVGRAAFDAESAQRLAATGDPVILMRPDTSTADVAGFAAARGIVTASAPAPRMRRWSRARWASPAWWAVPGSR